MIVWISALLFAFAGIALIIGRKPLAEMQSMLAGGHMPPGCVTAEGVALLLLALAAVVAYHLGLFGEL